jgi:F-type H+-transporting ATPase subunit epsilon
VSGTFSLEIVTPERLIFSGEVSSLKAPALDGLFGVLHNRAPYLVALAAGEVSFEPVGETTEHHVAITGGFFEVARNKAVLLADQAEFGHEIDVEEARRRYQIAKEELTKMAVTEEEARIRHHHHASASARLRAAERYRR